MLSNAGNPGRSPATPERTSPLNPFFQISLLRQPWGSGGNQAGAVTRPGQRVDPWGLQGRVLDLDNRKCGLPCTLLLQQDLPLPQLCQGYRPAHFPPPASHLCPAWWHQARQGAPEGGCLPRDITQGSWLCVLWDPVTTTRGEALGCWGPATLTPAKGGRLQPALHHRRQRVSAGWRLLGRPHTLRGEGYPPSDTMQFSL